MSKTCSQCRRELDPSAFGRRAASRDGLNARCKNCLNNDPRIKEYQRKYHSKNPEQSRERSRRHYAKNPAKRLAASAKWRLNNPVAYTAGKFAARIGKFGIDAEDWARMFNAQSGKCAVCDEALDGHKNTHVDHCHASGAVRGLLCTFCNSMLGYARDSLKNLARGIDYLRGQVADAP